jgi:hypothetical protein
VIAQQTALDFQPPVTALRAADGRYRYQALRAMAERIDRARTNNARRLCAESGLDPQLLGIHPHNAMIDYRAGRPWQGVNYHLVRACMREMDRSFEGHRILDRMYHRLGYAAFIWS